MKFETVTELYQKLNKLKSADEIKVSVAQSACFDEVMKRSSLSATYVEGQICSAQRHKVSKIYGPSQRYH